MKKDIEITTLDEILDNKYGKRGSKVDNPEHVDPPNPVIKSIKLSRN